MFKIKDKSFDIKHAYLDASISGNELIFGLQIKATGTDKHTEEDIEEEDMFFSEDEVSFNAEVLLKIKPHEINNWQEIVGKKIQWGDYPEDEDEPHALLYLYEHEEVYNADIEFKKIDEKIILSIKATCNLYSSENFSNNLPLEIETEVQFFGILFGADASEENCRKKTAPFLYLDNLKYVTNKYNVALLIPVDSDMEKNILVLGDY